MSFTTRCPVCGTVFRVVADQLKISDGWVRCGHCSDVFDATIHLQAWPPSSSAPATPTMPGEVPADAPAVAAAAPPPAVPTAPNPVATTLRDVPADDDLHAWFGEGPLDAPAAAAHTNAAPAPAEGALVDGSVAMMTPLAKLEVGTDGDPARAADEALTSDFHAELQRFAQTTRSSSSVATLPSSAREAMADAVLPPEPVRAQRDDEDEPAPEGGVPGFVRQARRRAYWSSPGVRIGLGTLACVLLALLAAQWALQERHRLVAMHPETRLWIERACALTGCDLAPIRRIDAVEIESAELVRRLGNFYSFDFVLRNRSSLEVALPALELTITSLGERPMARRVFQPLDWPDAPAALAPNGSVSVSLRLSLNLGEDAPTAGYRALVFYP